MFGGDESIRGFAKQFEPLILGGQRILEIFMSFLKSFHVI